MEVVSAFVAVAKVIGLGIKGWKALDHHGFGKEDLEALQAALETGAWAMPKSEARGAAALQLAMVAGAFGRAVGRHQEVHGMVSVKTRIWRWLDGDDRKREREIARRVERAALAVPDLSKAPVGGIERIDALIGDPIGTPYYRALWRAFSDPEPTKEGESPPLEMSGTVRREFERYFRLAYLTAMASPAGDTVAKYLGGLPQYRATLVRDLLVQDMATWGGRHVFGNVPRERWSDDEPVPFLPLEELYVEPLGAIEQKRGELGDPGPLAELIEQLVSGDEARVVLVVADFGSGKSLTARKLACRWAERWLDTTAVSLDAVLPVYVRCAEDFPHEAVDIEATVKSAWKRQARGFEIPIKVRDEALPWPEEGQRVVYLLDGLDEVVLGERQLKTLVQTLDEKTTERQRFVVFSRPGAVPAREELGEHVVVIRVLPFGPPQVEGWIASWNRLRADQPPVTAAGLARLGVGDVVGTPILLFMVALTWNQYTERTDSLPRAAIYESFFQQIAAGKAKVDKEKHNPIAAASDAVLVALTDRGVLEPGAGRPDAMLWLMGRVAWEAQMLEQRDRPRPLTTGEVTAVLHAELGLEREACHAIEIGLLLTLQSDLRTADHQILFGHQSFREFLVARRGMQLHGLVRGSQREWDSRTYALLGGRLLGTENKALDFLMQIINTESVLQTPAALLAWTDQNRETLVKWAQETFADEALVCEKRERGGPHSQEHLRYDLRTVMREAALAIGSLTRGTSGLRAQDQSTLRSMLAWFWLRNWRAIVIAPESKLNGAQLTDAHFSGANLYRANLERAQLDGAQLNGAQLNGANLERAHLGGTNLSGANLVEAHLEGAYLKWANLVDAHLEGAHLERANLFGAHLEGAHLERAHLEGAVFEGASLEEANLFRADLKGADLERADLERANLEGANLEGANLLGANLFRASLEGANLERANLERAIVVDLAHDATTIWPDDFDLGSIGRARSDS